MRIIYKANKRKLTKAEQQEQVRKKAHSLINKWNFKNEKDSKAFFRDNDIKNNN